MDSLIHSKWTGPVRYFARAFDAHFWFMRIERGLRMVVLVMVIMMKAMRLMQTVIPSGFERSRGFPLNAWVILQQIHNLKWITGTPKFRVTTLTVFLSQMSLSPPWIAEDDFHLGFSGGFLFLESLEKINLPEELPWWHHDRFLLRDFWATSWRPMNSPTKAIFFNALRGWADVPSWKARFGCFF